MGKNKIIKEPECVAGCMSYYGGEVKHHKDCPYYPESISKMYDDLQKKVDNSRYLLDEIKEIAFSDYSLFERIGEIKALFDTPKHKPDNNGRLFLSSFKKIPIIISKYNDNRVKGWRAEIAHNYENYKTAKYEDIDFEDLSFHFYHDIETHEKDAVECAKYVNKQYLGGKAKIWFL